MAHESSIPEKYGQPIPHDPDFSGPQKSRSCTDVLCLMLFIVFIGCWIGIALFAFNNGDPTAVLAPKDSNGLRCGIDDAVSTKKYLFFFDILKCVNPSVPFLGCPTLQICVSKCPDENVEVCDYENKNCKTTEFPTTNVQGRCIPELSKKWIDTHSSATAERIEKAAKNVKLIAETEQLGENVVDDVMATWPQILFFLLGALFCTLIYIMMLRWIAGVMVWCSLIGLIIALSLGVYGTWYSYDKMLKEEKAIDNEEVLESFHNVKKYFWLTALIVCSVTLTIILLVTIFLRKRICLAIALIEEGSKAISSVTSVLIFPVIPWILQIGVIVFFVSVGLLLTTTGTPLFVAKGTANSGCPQALNKQCDPHQFKAISSQCPDMTCKMIKMKHNDFYDYMQWLNVFGFFWGSFFVSAFSQMVLATVFATWYWTKPRRNLPFFAVTSASLNVLRYHIGTLAFGSLIIAVCRMIRLALEYIDRKLKKYDNEVTRAIMCLLKCFFWCLEKILKFISTNAYIMCAIHGKNFCTSAKDAFTLLMRNVIRYVVLDKVTDFLFFVSTLLISIGAGSVAYIYFATDLIPSDTSNLNYVEVPIVLIVLFTFFISKIFFHVYSMAVDTLFLCFLEDCERNDGSADRPYYMSKDLMKVFGKKNKVE